MKSNRGQRFIGLIALLVAGVGLVPTLAAEEGAATRPAVVKVACIGDSITFGSGLEDRRKESYPSQLQSMLDERGGGKKWEVQNFGVSGSTLLERGDRPYRDQKRFTAAREFAPDIVIIKLGTNDSKPQNWEHKQDFSADLTALINEFRDLPGRPTVWLCRPVPAFPGKYGIRNEVIRDQILPVIDAVAKEQNVPVIDLYTALSNKPQHFPDTIHPNTDGAKLIAAEIHKALIEAATAPTATAPAAVR